MYEKTIINIQEIKARKRKNKSPLVTEGGLMSKWIVDDDCIDLPETLKFTQTIDLLVYYNWPTMLSSPLPKRKNVDQPEICLKVSIIKE